MCLRLSLFQRIPRIALRDIHVYKILQYQIGDNRRVLISPFQETIYELNETYHSILDSGWLFGTVDSGRHSYVNLCDAERQVGVEIYSSHVFHAVIPRGSIYYKGYFGGDDSIASNKLKVTHEVTNINPTNPNNPDEYFTVTYD